MKKQSKGEKTRARLLKEVRNLIVANGFRNTTINQIIEVTGVKKGALYFHFANKDELGFAILINARDEFFRFLSDSLQGDTPLAKIDRFFTAMIARQTDVNFVAGCLFGNTALEMSDSNERFAEVIDNVFTAWIDILTGLLLEAKETGLLSWKIDPRLFAMTIVASLEGGIILARASKRPSDLEDCVGTLRFLLKESLYLNTNGYHPPSPHGLG